MRVRTLLAVVLLPLAGCSLTLDPDSVERPTAACAPSGCSGKACGYDDCGHVCVQGTDPCEVTHTIRGGVVAAAGRVPATATAHGVQGEVVSGAGNAAASSGHSITQGSISR